MPTGRHRQVIRISLLLCAMYALLAARLYHVQVTEAATLSHTQLKYQTRLPYRLGSAQFERPARGSIYDRHGNPLAVGFDTYQLLLDMYPLHRPRNKKDKPLTIAQRIDVLSGVLRDLGVEHNRLEMLEKAEKGYYDKVMKDGTVKRVCKRGILLLKGLSPWHRRYIKKIMFSLRITNFGFLAEPAREYPHGELVAEIVGFVGQSKESNGEVSGRAGVEASLDTILNATPGKFTCEKDGRGKEMELGGVWLEEPELGYDVNLTLDVDIQEIAANALAKACEKFKCPTGSALVLDSNTGEILAMTSFPRVSVEAVRKGKVSAKDFLCLPFTATFEPGSTIKPLILAKAIEKGAVHWLDQFDTNNGRRLFRSAKRTRWLSDSHPNQVLTAEEVIIQSSNIGIAMIGFEKLGYAGLVDSVHELGLQNRIRLRMPGSPRHRVPKHNNPREIDAGVSVPFGHQITLSPLAMTAAFNVLATGGIYHTPRLVRSVIREDEVVPNTKKSKRVLREDIADHTLDVLERTVNEGTGKVLKDLPWHVGAKTGTAQRWDKNTRSFNSSMIAIAPVANPRITVYVGLYDVRGAIVTAGQTAGPAVREIIQECLEHMSITPDREQKETVK